MVSEYGKNRGYGEARSAGKRPSKRPSRIDDLIEAAIRLFGEQGVENVTVEEIAAECGLAERAVYYHFATKDDLTLAAFARVRDEVDEIVAAAPDLPTAVRRTFEWGTTNPARAQMLWVRSVGVNTDISELWERFITSHVNATRRYRGDMGSSTGGPEIGSTDWIAARVAVIGGTLIQTYWGSGDIGSGHDADEVAGAVLDMFQKLIVG
jgi:AcrR family transcriptional regulator